MKSSQGSPFVKRSELAQTGWIRLTNVLLGLGYFELHFYHITRPKLG
jgi:hypothetical protein